MFGVVGGGVGGKARARANARGDGDEGGRRVSAVSRSQ